MEMLTAPVRYAGSHCRDDSRSSGLVRRKASEIGVPEAVAETLSTLTTPARIVAGTSDSRSARSASAERSGRWKF